MQFPYVQFHCTVLSGDMMFDPFWEAVCRLERCDFKGLGATADGLSTNRHLFKLHGASGVASQLVCEGQEREKEPLVVIPYVAGMSKDIRRVCRKFNIRVVFKSGRTLRSMLTKVKDTLPLGKQSNVVYRIPCSCGQVYIRETKRRLETRLKEHRDACERGMMEKSAVVEHMWENHHPID